MPKLFVIPGSPPPDTPAERVRKRIRASKPAHVISCHRCGGIEVMETKLGVEYVDGRARGGTKQVLCATCWRGGERVVLA